MSEYKEHLYTGCFNLSGNHSWQVSGSTEWLHLAFLGADKGSWASERCTPSGSGYVSCSTWSLYICQGFSFQELLWTDPSIQSGKHFLSVHSVSKRLCSNYQRISCLPASWSCWYGYSPWQFNSFTYISFNTYILVYNL